MVKLKHLCFSMLLLMLSGCSMQPKTSPIQIEVAAGQFIALPKPAELEQNLNISQLITAQWGDSKKQKMLVQLQVDNNEIVLAGFSAWGAPLLSLSYSGDDIKTFVLTGFAATLPKPEQVLFNIMISIWPVDSWGKPLSKIGWSLIENEFQRLLINEKGDLVADVTYQKHPYLDGTIVFTHHLLRYQITIETNKKSIKDRD